MSKRLTKTQIAPPSLSEEQKTILYQNMVEEYNLSSIDELKQKLLPYL